MFDHLDGFIAMPRKRNVSILFFLKRILDFCEANGSVMCHFVLVFFSPFSIAITSLGDERANLSAFRTFVRFVLVWICRFPLPLGVWEGLRFVIVALPGLFLLPFFGDVSFSEQPTNRRHSSKQKGCKSCSGLSKPDQPFARQYLWLTGKCLLTLSRRGPSSGGTGAIAEWAGGWPGA